ncbi:type IV secretory system conjugative DNA transfer family protein [Jiangella muralis]|uniref:type IV secretory system conjugative DNA transfer family protein n=1 Tax=Jiangella muralis TaxID=702383 RepID=UPI0009FA156D|nr:type IV secretory system conjugative DNA transfer family protein [Jiangella muralis]
MARPPEPRSTDLLTDLALAVLLTILTGAAAVSGIAWAGAVAAAWITGHPAPDYSVDAAVAAIRAPGQPEQAWTTPLPAAGVVWSATGVVAAIVIAATVAGAWLWRRAFGTSQNRSRALEAMPGVATARQVRAVAGARMIRAHGPRLRPSLRAPEPPDIGFCLGRSHRIPVWITVEDSVLVIGPSRSGKGLHLVIPSVLDAPGAVVSTSTRTDVLAATLTARSRIGPVAVFDPQHLARGIDAGMRWNPVRGCEDPQTAMIRARGLAAGSNIGKGVENADFWAGQTEAVIRTLLHAAALDDLGARDLYRWSLDPVAAMQAHRILTTHNDAASGWAETLEAAATADARTRDSIWLGVRQAFAGLADPRVLDALTPRPGEREFDPIAFVRDGGALFLLGTAAGAGGVGTLVAALIEDLLETARQLAAASPGARLDPPLALVLDEIANLAPLPSLPTLVSEGGGSGIATTVVLQTMAQARHAFGEHTASTIWDASVVKILPGGAASAADLRDISALIGDRDDETVAVTRGRDGDTTRQVSYRRIPILDPGQLRTLRFGQAVVLLRSAPPIALSMQPWTRRPDAHRLQADKSAVETSISARAEQSATSAPDRTPEADQRPTPNPAREETRHDRRHCR